ncbi:MAG: CBS domain-containing protein, partial [Candidatus Eremiobacteraeota bacterium]|nr:CBS domain-containing protein [Candidatus Eremiobacteraeota bacterium]
AKGELPKLITLSPNDSVRRAVELMREFKISQIPVVENGAIVGSINEVAVMQLIFDHADIVHGEVKAVMSRPFPMLDENEEVAHAYKELSLGHAAVVVAHEGKAIGVLTKMDIINYLSAS